MRCVECQSPVKVTSVSENIQDEYDTLLEHTAGHSNIIAFWNKTDIAGDREFPVCENKSGIRTVYGSVLKNRGIDDLFDAVESIVWGGRHSSEPEIAVSARHRHLLEEALDAQKTLSSLLLEHDWELAAVQLRTAIAALGTITGEDADPDVLDDIFSRFCIGK
jgi:tRNA modification GTPase